MKVRPVPQTVGGIRYAVDQLVNPYSITFNHGGFFSPTILLYGRVDTVSDEETAIRLYRAFANAIGKSFKRVRAFWVGPDAYEHFRHGCRLTIGANSPTEYDLAE